MRGFAGHDFFLNRKVEIYNAGATANGPWSIAKTAEQRWINGGVFCESVGIEIKIGDKAARCSARRHIFEGSWTGSQCTTAMMGVLGFNRLQLVWLTCGFEIEAAHQLIISLRSNSDWEASL